MFLFKYKCSCPAQFVFMLENVPAMHKFVFMLENVSAPILWQSCEHVVKYDFFDILQKSNENGLQEEINLIMKEDIIQFGNKTIN